MVVVSVIGGPSSPKEISQEQRSFDASSNETEEPEGTDGGITADRDESGMQ